MEAYKTYIIKYLLIIYNIKMTESTQTRCNKCEGSGFLKYEKQKCETCKGNKCVDCKSTGFQKMPWDSCDNCYGDGFFIIKKSIMNKHK
jgi:DnaJ-class molecular chaperone